VRTRRFCQRLLLTSALLLSGLLIPLQEAAAAPIAASGFSDEVVFADLDSPVATAFSPDGRVFVAERSGIIKVFDSLTDPAPSVAVDLRTETDNFWDRGLLGIALDPQFPARPYLYALYTYDALPGEQAPQWGTANTDSDACPDPPGATTDGCQVQGRLVKLTLDGDFVTEPAQVLVTGWCQQFPSHSVGTVLFGPDGALYASAGEGASFNYADWGQRHNPCGDPGGPVGADLSPPAAAGGALRAQSIRRPGGQPIVLSGSVIRVDPDSGAGIPGNPFYGSNDPNKRRIIAYGLRNPFRFGVRPGTDQLWVGDVGWSSYEEIDKISDVNDNVAENFGWPCYEGPAKQSSYDAANLDMCESLYSAGGASGPKFSYRHDQKVLASDSCATGSSSVTGIAFERGSNYPASYQGAMFFADSSRGCIWAMKTGANGDPDPNKISLLLSGAGFPTQVVLGPGGDLFWVGLQPGEIHRISYTGANHVPTATFTANRTDGQSPLLVNYDASGSSDLDGDALTYAWDLDGDGNFDDASTVDPSFQYNEDGPVTVRLRVSDPHGASATQSLTIRVGPPDTPPEPVIDSPGDSLHWKVGDTIDFSGHAGDAEDGTLPASKLSWSLVIHHCPSNCHIHEVQGLPGVATGSFPAPDHEYPAYLELSLTATDSAGETATTSVRLDPRTVDITVASNPPGLQVSMFSTTITAPATRTVITGSSNGIGAVTPQTTPDGTYDFVSWSDRGAAVHNIIAGSTPATYTATYKLRPAGPVAAWSFDQGGGGTAPDATGRGHTGTLSGGVTWASPGKHGGALRFDGVSGMVNVADAADLRLASRFTLEAWVRPSTVTGRRTVILKDRPGGLSYGLYAGSNNRVPQGYAYLGGAERAISGTGPIALNTWDHIAVSYDSHTLVYYLNGTRAATHAATGAIPALTGTLHLGSNPLWGEHFTGQIDDVRIYNRALSGPEIAADRDRAVSP
jgi:glucose/arabinose dehydrogenase